MPDLHPIGLNGLIEELGLSVDPPAVRSVAGAVTRRTEEAAYEVRETYPLQYDCHTLRDHLRFALRNEPLDLRIWKAILEALPPNIIGDWVREMSTSSYARRAWYLYERLTQERLPLPDAQAGPYANVADPEIQVVWKKVGWNAPRSARHRVRNNLLGTGKYCPLVRLTRRLRAHGQQEYGRKIAELTSEADPLLFKRAANYLYLSETKSSYAIEGESPTPDREERFVSALERAGEREFGSQEALVQLQRQIVQDPRFQAGGWRSIQNYVGQTRIDYTEEVLYPCPKPEDLPDLMADWLGMVQKIYHDGDTDPVVLAAVVSFGFVYLHPFEDGNGRLHRYLIHHVLAQLSYTPQGVIFPVSAVFLRRRNEYESVLQTVSRLVKPLVRYILDDQNRMTVTNDTVDLYRYPDLTPHAEFLYDSIAEAIEKDWPRELRFLSLFDDAFRAVQRVVDMPDAKIRLIVRLLMQNHGQLARNKRRLFDFLSDDEIRAIESGVQKLLEPIAPD